MESVPPSGTSLMLHLHQVGHVVYDTGNVKYIKVMKDHLQISTS